MSDTTNHFPTDTAGLPEAHAPELVELSDGDQLELRVAPVTKRLGDATVRMLAYNGSIPGPVIKVKEGAEIVVHVENRGDMDATVHWHGLRLENRFDGTHETQAPILVGERFSAKVAFPDPGRVLVPPAYPRGLRPGDGAVRQLSRRAGRSRLLGTGQPRPVLTLDDILLEDGKVAPFSQTETNYVAMGRFGEVLLVNGEADLSLDARLGEVVRLYLTNTANTRTFKVALPGAKLKLVGGDSGHVEHEQLVEEVVVAPSERVVLDVLFDKAGDMTLEHRTPERVYALAAIHVSDDRVEESFEEQFAVLRTNADMVSERERVAAYLDAEPDKTVGFIAEMDMEAPEGPVVYACPMHPDVVRTGRALPRVRDETARGRCPLGRLCLPDAPRGHQRGARALPEVPDEAAACGDGRRGRARTRPRRPRRRPRAQPRHLGRHRVGRRHGGCQSDHHPREHALEARRSRDG